MILFSLICFKGNNIVLLDITIIKLLQYHHEHLIQTNEKPYVAVVERRRIYL